MGLISDYLDWVRQSYVEYDQAITEQDLGVGADYEALTGDKFEHALAAGAIGLGFGTPIAGIIAHGGYHLFERIFSGASDYGSIDTIVEDGGIVYPELSGWRGPSGLMSSASGRKIHRSKPSSFRRCRTTSRPGRRCTRRIGHPMPHRF